MRVALLTYRGNPHVGGQGIYVRHLARALAGRGHDVTVFSGQPYPDLDGGVRLVEVPSLDLYRDNDPFRRPKMSEFRDGIDVLEFATMCAAGFPEPLTFSLRARRLLASRLDQFDLVHDNQGLGYGMLDLARRIPVLATIHHPISIDRRLALIEAQDAKARLIQRRWFSFVRMQRRVARRLAGLLAVSTSGRVDIETEFGIERAKISVVPNGVDTELFRPVRQVHKIPGRVVTVASSDLPMKGLSVLIEAVAKLSTERELELVLVGAGGEGRNVAGAIERFGMRDKVTITGRVEALKLVELLNSAEIAVVPSLYEGFSLPAIESMSCGTPILATTAGALQEVVGAHGETGWLVPPGDPEALASAMKRLLDEAGLRAVLGRQARERVLQLFSWDVAAAGVEGAYRKVLRSC